MPRRFQPGHHAPGPIIWVDDLALYLESSQPTILIDQIRFAVRSIQDRCAEKGLTLNFARGKSEVLLRLQGRGSHAAHQRLREEVPGWLTVRTEPNEVRISMASVYTHLGQKHNSAMTMEPEIAFRILQASTALTDCKALLVHKGISLSVKLLLARSLIFSKLLFGACVWDELPTALVAKLEAFALKVLRIITRQGHRKDRPQPPNDEVYAMAAQPSVADMIRIARLRHVQRLFVHAPRILLVVLQQQHATEPRSWFSLVQADLQWAQQRQRLLQSDLPPIGDLPTCMEFIASLAKRWPSLCSSLYRKAAITHQMHSQLSVWKKQVRQGLNLQVEEGTPEAPLQFFCPQCPASFASHRALANHQAIAHKKFAAARAFMPFASVCQMCLRDYGCTQKLRQHVQYRANQCWNQMEQILSPMTSAQIEAVETIALRKVKDQHRPPAVRLAGPLLPTRD
eukprot:Skav235663  [mRNA]  locus=scaffold358:923762:926781:+ [translate_table: standard]